MMATTTKNLPDDPSDSYAGTVVPVAMALIAWEIHGATQDLLAPWAMYLAILSTWVVMLSISARFATHQKCNLTAADLSYEVSDVSYNDVQGYMEDGCPRSRCLHNIWADDKPEEVPNSPPSDHEEPKSPSIWDGKVIFSCTPSEAEIAPMDSITQDGILGWEMRVLRIQKDKLHKERLERIEKEVKHAYGFPLFQQWPRDPSLTYKQNWKKWYKALQEYRVLHPLTEEQLAEEKKRKEEQREKIEKWWYEKQGIPRPAPLPKICVFNAEGKVEHEEVEASLFYTSWRRIEDSYQSPEVDEEFLWPHWRPRNAQREWEEATLLDEGESFEGLWINPHDEYHEWKSSLVWDDMETY
ncbi:hypothetical protein QBC41DRAFT_232741 [Cercophora samala]|uniref:Uncharacterized protein n=1 Tax=Cercophora samala TaxID=330535 RepID=A0AA39Z742_9PEZI|nr:hypothetical protein QBC41DRAFT_232741 [Cercophora samala]